jgi:hypothetical protein
VDTNPLVLLISNDPPADYYLVARIGAEAKEYFQSWVEAEMPTDTEVPGVLIERKPVKDGLRDGMSRFSLVGRDHHGLVLGDVVKVLRGIATGANQFFFLTRAQVKEHGLPPELFVRAIGRTRDIDSDLVSSSDLDRLDVAGRPTWLLNLDNTPFERLGDPVRKYLTLGANQGLHELALIRQRKPWYKMERRTVPPHLFAYLGRRSARFIRNEAGVVPLTSFLCVYPKAGLCCTPLQLTELLSDPAIGEGFHAVAKSYGGGAIKLEPRSLERAPLLTSILARHEWLDQLIRMRQEELQTS